MAQWTDADRILYFRFYCTVCLKEHFMHIVCGAVVAVHFVVVLCLTHCWPCVPCGRVPSIMYGLGLGVERMCDGCGSAWPRGDV